MLATIFHTIFFIIIAIFGIVSLLAIYVYIRYGRTPAITLASSAVFAALFLVGVGTAYIVLQHLIKLYA